MLLLAGAASMCFGKAVRSAEEVDLIGPNKKSVIVEGPVTFVWRVKATSDSAGSAVRRCEVSFWSKRDGFERTYTIPPEEFVGGRGLLRLDDCRKVFRRHGTYFWRVTVYLADGNVSSSDIWQFDVGLPRSDEDVDKWNSSYAVRFQYNHRFQTPEYRTFLADINNKTQLRSFSDMSLVFRQNGLLIRSMQCEERLIFLSQIGLGCGLSTRIRALKWLYAAVYPKVEFESHWFSLGLKDYTSTLTSIGVGCDLAIMPGGYITIQSSWLPVYRIRYSEKGDELRTFLGEGWEFGVRWIIPNHIVGPFRFLGVEFDFHRLPMEFHFGRVRDDYTGTWMKWQRFNMMYYL